MALAISPLPASAVQPVSGSAYTRPHALDFVKNVPKDLKAVGKSAVKKKNLPTLGLIVGSTALLMLFDQKLVYHSQQLGNDLHITHTNYQKTLFTVPVGKAHFNVEGPFDSGSALYFIGDGWLEVLIAGGLLTYGFANSDNRAIRTTSEMAEAVLAAGLVAQALKHVTGRGSPFTQQANDDTWRFFPNQRDYAAHVASYDAFPSGHFTASMAVLTVAAENYPEHRWIRPVGYSLFGLLAFQMMNNGVHWASDYPLAIALGYSFGRVAASRGKHSSGSDLEDESSSLQFLPYVGNGGLGGFMVYRFGGRSSREKSDS
ncbi:MAG: phosphatase PAP2 family protein [Elusimicrobia bacterium]|nr:phosphatase PAP2 family protein [Elusimicrobiota bacterium]